MPTSFIIPSNAQELSKKFITGSPAEFYEQFMHATLLQRDYDIILDTVVRCAL